MVLHELPDVGPTFDVSVHQIHPRKLSDFSIRSHAKSRSVHQSPNPKIGSFVKVLMKFDKPMLIDEKVTDLESETCFFCFQQITALQAVEKHPVTCC